MKNLISVTIGVPCPSPELCHTQLGGPLHVQLGETLVCSYQVRC